MNENHQSWLLSNQQYIEGGATEGDGEYWFGSKFGHVESKVPF